MDTHTQATLFGTLPDAARVEITHRRQTLWAAGFKPVPLLTGQKHTNRADWQITSKTTPPGPVDTAYQGTGVLCDGLRAVDIDIEDEAKADAVSALADKMLGGCAPLRYRNNSPRCAMIYCAAEGEPPKRAIIGPILGKNANGKEMRHKVEVLGRGQQLHIFGLHPSGARIAMGRPATWRHSR